MGCSLASVPSRSTVAGGLESTAFLCSFAKLTTLFLCYNKRFDKGTHIEDLNKTLKFTSQLTALRSLRVRALMQAQ